MEKRFNLVIFDCDGVLVDTERVSNQVMADLMAEQGLALGFDAAVEHFIGRSTAHCLAIAETLLGRALPPDLAEQYERRTQSAFERRLEAIPGIEEVLESLSLPFCVASNGERAKMRFTLGRTGLLRWFEGRVFSAEDVARPKPEPDLFLHAAQVCGAAAARCVVVEDTPTGVRAARAAGMAVIGFAGLTPVAHLREAGAQTIIQRMSELPEYL